MFWGLHHRLEFYIPDDIKKCHLNINTEFAFSKKLTDSKVSKRSVCSVQEKGCIYGEY